MNDAYQVFVHDHAHALPQRREILERCQREVDRAREEQAHAVDRIRRDSAREVERERRAILESLLPVLDDLDRAIAAAQGSPDPAVAQGIELVRGRFLGILAGHGVRPFGERGDRFDPAVHDAIARTADSGVAHGRVAEIATRGYRVGDEVLRPAGVTVAWHEDQRAIGEGAPSSDEGARDGRPRFERPAPHRLRARRIPIRRL